MLAIALAVAITESCAATEEPGPSQRTSTALGQAELRIPEPMVFDLVRPLGAARGELEVNTLGLVRTRRHVRLRETPGPLGLLAENSKLPAVEVSPEVEVAVWDGFAVELELPFEGSELAAIKPAVQWTIGRAFGGRYIHGLQFIGQYELDPRIWAPTAVYIGATRFSRRSSLVGMVGIRGELGEAGDERVQYLANLAPFVDLMPELVAGVEANFGQVVKGRTDLLLAPQLHYKWNSHFALQAGFGMRFVREVIIPQFIFRLIREF